jgi:hypothetical protein
MIIVSAIDKRKNPPIKYMKFVNPNIQIRSSISFTKKIAEQSYSWGGSPIPVNKATLNYLRWDFYEESQRRL